MTATDYLEQKLLDHTLRNTAYTQPPALYMALHFADPGESGTVSELTGAGYVRKVIAFDATVAGSGQALSNVAANFTNLPATTVTHFSIKDAVVSGNTLYVGPLASPRTVVLGDALNFPAGQVVITCD